MARSGMEIRSALLALPPEGVLGTALTAPRATIVRAYQTRRAQLEGHRDATSSSPAQRVGIADALRLLAAALELARDPRSVREYHVACRERGTAIPLASHVEFERGLHDPGLGDRTRAAAARPHVAQPRGAGARGTAPPAGAGAPNPMSSAAADALAEATAVVARIEEERSRVTTLPSAPGVRGRLGESASHLLVASDAGLNGTERTGDLVYGVGDPRPTLLAVSTAFALVLSFPLLMTMSTRLDTFETGFDSRATLWWLRVAFLSVVSVLSVRLLFGESLGRLGWRVRRGSDLVAPLALGAVATAVSYFALPLEVIGTPRIGVVLAFVAARAVSESLFFEGVVVRRLLVALPDSRGAVVMGLAYYGIYANTYRFMWDPTSESPATFGTPLYALLVAAPAGYAMYRTRSWLPPMVIRLATLSAAALAAAAAAPIG
ncbi:MAG: hypothetical protein H6697_03420 [Myxococcales bacterium]|nr:hypothetical protein [Myxococcales bacterium]